MSSIHQQLRRTIRRYSLLPAGGRVVVGLSGGSDSVALTRLLLELSEHGDFTVAGVAHLNHQLRPSADSDEAFCREFAARLGLAIETDRVDVLGYAHDHRLSVEEAARRLRYEFLGRAASAFEADRIAVGHTQDDQAETLLLKLIRGAGLTGLAGIYPRRDNVVRPLLGVSRAELREYLRSVGQSWRDDETNEDLTNPRNRVRHVVIPELDIAAGWACSPAIARAAHLSREDADFLDDLARQYAARVETAHGAEPALDAAELALLPGVLVRRILLESVRRHAGGREIGLEHVEAVLELLGRTTGGVDLPGCRVELRRGKLVLLQQGAPDGDTLGAEAEGRKVS